MNPKLTRRRFIKGVIFSGAAAATGSAMYLGAQSRTGAISERLLSLNVNGRTRLVDVPPSETLAFTLRNRLGLTGTKVACNRGECGACTVMLDNVANYSCSVLTHSVKTRAITTVEGLRAADGTLSAVQRGFIDRLVDHSLRPFVHVVRNEPIDGMPHHIDELDMRQRLFHARASVWIRG